MYSYRLQNIKTRPIIGNFKYKYFSWKIQLYLLILEGTNT